ncbi:uncharacterized protein PHALS_04102 [Plasmopara halstedii]|uniref:Uncharacterized protein n=1 Tax=Plasmopara halstedii TaxID=4781 RepID=A0A0P1A8G2_PLAHL|nr:uncharacterized protein PHALS_04102 [Plasmopara halstedii]CEG36848.1 hypothetical protein PHALS_04102 [Plasmopara halstedii]|eukprot:XP_024573217.1 hypothetical protein PHALS_04102 [Plasmopara halstedii]
MSAWASRRETHGVLPGNPVSEIRTRRWTRQLKNIGHLTIAKWIPDHENPTDALQKGVLKKAKGRKRGAGEVGRMTRSVRQHMAAPLELLSEYPARVNPMPTPMPTPTPTSTPAQVLISCDVAFKQECETGTSIKKTFTDITRNNALKAEASPLTHATSASPALTLSMMPITPSVSNQMMTEVPSDEQLEMVLDDLPMLDADDNFALDALDHAFLPPPAPIGASCTIDERSTGVDLSQHSVENSSASVSEDDGSANSGSSMPSASPQSSPGMSRSPSP